MDWTNLLSAALGAVLAGVFLLAGQYINAHLAQRRDAKGRRYEALLAARDAAHHVRRVFDYRRTGTDSIQGRPDLDAALDELRRLLAPVPDPELRARFVFILEALAYTSAIRAFANTSEIAAGRLLCDHAIELLEASLHGSRLPNEPETLSTYRAAIDEADEIAAQVQQEHSDS